MKTIDIIEKIKNENSKNNKLAILKENENDLNLRTILNLTYNKQILFFINIDSEEINKVGNNTINTIDGFSIICDVLDDLSNRKITGKAAHDKLIETIETYDSKSQQIIIGIVNKDLRLNLSENTLSKVWKTDYQDHKVQLANKFANCKKLDPEYYISPKLDGIRATYHKGIGLKTRQNKIICGFENTIEKEAEKICKLANINFIDGELFSSELTFDEIQGAVCRNVNIDLNEKKKIKFKVFAICINFKEKGIFKTTKEMVGKINEIFENKFDYIEKVDQKLISLDEVASNHDLLVEQGYEGSMLRSTKVSYSFKRDNNLLKLKNFEEDDFEIIDYYEGKGQLLGSLGGIKVKKDNIISEVGSGFDIETRKKLWKDKESLIGKIVEIRYQDITNSEIASLRFPTFVKFKEDRTYESEKN